MLQLWKREAGRSWRLSQNPGRGRPGPTCGEGTRGGIPAGSCPPRNRSTTILSAGPRVLAVCWGLPRAPPHSPVESQFQCGWRWGQARRGVKGVVIKVKRGHEVLILGAGALMRRDGSELCHCGRTQQGGGLCKPMRASSSPEPDRAAPRS